MMEEELCGVQSGDDKSRQDKNKKRIVKTHSQIEALEKFYNEHNYPSEPMKLQLAASIGLTEKQVSGWFCHRRSKDRKLLNEDTGATGRQDRSSGVIQDRGSGHRQDSCGSTKQGEYLISDTREVESGMLTHQEFPSADLTGERGSKYIGNYDRIDEATSGSSSSLRNMPSHHNPFDVATSRSLSKLPLEEKGAGAKGRSGPSGYLKVKGRIQNSAITAVQRQLGRHYREDGPPLGVEFDLLPPGAFESSTQDPVDEAFYGEDPVLPFSPGVSQTRQYSRFGMDHDYKLGFAHFEPDVEHTKMMHGSDAPESCVPQKFGQNLFYPNNSTCHSADRPEKYVNGIPHSESKIDHGERYRQGGEVVRIDSAMNRHHLPSFSMNLEGERNEYMAHRSNDVGLMISQGEEYEDEACNIATIKGKRLQQLIMKDGKFYGERKAMDRNLERVRVEIPMKNEMSAPKTIRRSFAISNMRGDHCL